MNAISASDSIESNLYNAYLSLLAAKIVHPQEMLTLDAWLEDVQTAT